MIYEKIEDLDIDIDKLRDHLLLNVLPNFEPTMQSTSFGGWSVQSAEGTCDDGWQQGHLCFKEVDGKMVYDYKMAREIKFVPEVKHRKPTPICTGYLAEVMEKISRLRFFPRRARISILTAGGYTDWHMDAKPGTYAVRLHIPIITNPEAVFAVEDGAAHMPADGSAYLVRVDRLHQARNGGKENRYHLIMQVWDSAHVSQNHRYETSTTLERIRNHEL